MALKVVILAAGKGTRMRSKLPKVLQPLANKSLLQHVIDTAEGLDCQSIITVIGHGSELVEQRVKGHDLTFVMQEQQLGTGHAVQQATPLIDADDTILVLYGDVPLTSLDTLKDLLSLVSDNTPLSLLTINLDNPTGYGRIVRDQHNVVQAIVEQKDASDEQLTINEVNTGILAAKGKQLNNWLSRLESNNAQSEFYLTDIIEMCVHDGFTVATTQPNSEIEVLGVNDKVQLQTLERMHQNQQARLLMQQGVTIIDANRIDIRGSVQAAADVEIDVNVIFEGRVVLGENVIIGANCILKDVTVAANTVVHPFSHIEDCIIGADCIIGPYARLRPGTELGNNAKIGNFVETKKSIIGEGSKVNHLSYIGDTVMGQDVNIGAGTITCNYDGVNKHKTIIGDRVFVGSDSQLVAPVIIGDNATIGAGSTITKNAPETQLTLSRSKQLTIANWQKPTKK
ncbi:bifunctional UDP-N-acetylglucosamine diphosphorylase/glucosamine-1-phosphate N-acetyltransferase GlmU [Thiomicrorhabdus lithotrophica]|uniref:Bifunctional protein GlmU n=1 Tax=Thiomicrorhabdus lithotrophica TaxID=2949997 RepID=A0ABY8CET0_9GAMM|nr:bifunctional UDP-N-acetylglucosamine diphosphorylase/glucosamine-1-phosphate N-acetyltransferase GlmU [Thiomicrorhabdus lithotrophica]WEJ62613.1 bifunctional UDP-N-acetylglucosamine diphosphorylase/glucosamine-1-phosphate N-acetyltransferase GlmU [Thiomicrorhabdus lithotrophica]